MLRERSPRFRVWLVLTVGAVAPGVMALLGHPAREVFTLDSLLELLRVGVSGAFSALFALFVEKPRDPNVHRTRADDLNVPGAPVEDRRRLPESAPVIVVPVPAPPKEES